MRSPRSLLAILFVSALPTYAVTYSPILDLNESVTGVRRYDDNNVVLTGSYQSSGETFGMWWLGSLTTGTGTSYQVAPNIPDQTITTSLYYGPNTARFEPGLGAGNIRVVGSYQYSESSVLNHGVMYTGPVNGIGGTWKQIDVPSAAVGGATVLNTIPHSTMGNFVVGNYDLDGDPGSANAFLYNISLESWTIFDIGGTANLTSAYGIWQNGVGSDSYTIAGGSMHEGLNRAYLVNYDASNATFGTPTFFDYNGAVGLTHFEGITGVEGGYNVIATTDSGAAFAFISRNLDGTFGDALWTAISYPNSTLSTGNTVIDNVAMGIYSDSDISPDIHSYTATVPEPSAIGIVASLLLVAHGVRRARRLRRG